MSRRHADPVEVRTRVEPAGPVPDQFLWRGRLYCVREVLARWTEAGSWWRGAGVVALTSGAGDEPAAAPLVTAPLVTAPVPASPRWGQRAWGEPAPDVGAAVGPAGVDDRSSQWWRVEADSGRLAALSGGRGTYDLCFEESTTSWSLRRVVD